MDRRLFLQTLSAVTLSQLLGACQQNNRAVLEVNSLQKTLPPQLIGKFRSQSQVSAQISIKSSTEEIFSQLQKIWQGEKQTNPATDSTQKATASAQKPVMPPQRLASLGDYWLPKAIQQNLIQPLPVSDLSRWSDLLPRWQQLVRRDLTGHLAP